MNRVLFSLKRAWEWIAERPLHQTGLRIFAQVARQISGVPVRRYSQISPLLHIGGQHYPQGLPALRARGISAVVNLRKEFDDEAAGVALEHYLHLPVIDNTAPSQEELQAGVDFMTEQIGAGRGVYVHCGVGVGRAPTMAAAYLVSTGLTPNQAWARLRAVRPFIWANGRQRAAVNQFAQGQQTCSPTS
ncbi:MAG: dual specificity protein phosphatase family protein [Anaerolineae bacterium]|nr:dual specificity protein phosphatase family protein [Anaerolineae bacterium]